MFHLLLALAMAEAPPPHWCVGDFLFRGTGGDQSVGVRVRREPDSLELSIADGTESRSTAVSWTTTEVLAVMPPDQSKVRLTCSPDRAILTLPDSGDAGALSLMLDRVDGGLREIGEREGWLKAR